MDNVLAEGYSTSDVLLQLQADTLLGGGRSRLQESGDASSTVAAGTSMDVDEGTGLEESGGRGKLPCAKGRLSKLQMARICMKLAEADVALLDCADEELQLKDVAVSIMATCT